MIRRLALPILLAASAATAQDLTLPSGARPLAERISPLDSYALPVGVHDGQGIPAERIEGRVERTSWRIGGGALTTLQVLAPLRDQLDAAGFALLLDCADRECGGFDFRFGTEVLPAPDMFVAIRDYRFLSARRGGTALSLLVSRSGSDVFVQMIRVTPPAEAVARPPAGAQSQVPEPAPDEAALTAAERLQRDGHTALDDLEFASGSATLGNGDFASLASLAALMTALPDLRLALVGHTDNVGAAADNLALSKRRAEAVRTRLTEKYGIDPARIEAEGVGYLAPVASNATAEGREANRRVEAVLLTR